MTWPRVCRDVEAEAAATVGPPRPPAPAPAPAGPPARSPVPSGRKSLVDPNDPPHVQAEMAKLESIFDDDEKRRLPR